MHEKHKHFNMNMNDHSTQTIPYLPAYHTHFFPKINMKHGRCMSYAGICGHAPLNFKYQQPNGAGVLILVLYGNSHPCAQLPET
jgi:hypothetical protein